MEKVLLNLLSQVDSAVLQIALKYPDEFRCRKGCSDCCHAAFDISLAEAVLIRRHFLQLGRKTRRKALKTAQKALRAWNEALRAGQDISKLRITCPLLNMDEECLLYEVRPVNCRTYGVPTEIDGKGHVCTFSGFKPGIRYPTVRLHVIQEQLLKISMEIAPELANRRWPIAQVILSDMA